MPAEAPSRTRLSNRGHLDPADKPFTLGRRSQRGARKIPLSESHSATYREGTEGYFLDHKSKIEGESPFQPDNLRSRSAPKHASAINKAFEIAVVALCPASLAKRGGGASKRPFGIPKNSGIPFALDAPWIGANRRKEHANSVSAGKTCRPTSATRVNSRAPTHAISVSAMALSAAPSWREKCKIVASARA